MDELQRYLAALNTIAPQDRERGNIEAVLKTIDTAKLLESLQGRGFVNNTITDSYGAGL